MLLAGQCRLRQPGAGLWNAHMAKTFQNIGLLEPELPIKVFVWQWLLESIIRFLLGLSGATLAEKQP